MLDWCAVRHWRAFMTRWRRKRLQKTKVNLDRIMDEWAATSEDPTRPYVGLALQYQSVRPWEAAALAHIRSKDAGQIAAVNILQAARNARAARWAVTVAALSVPLNVGLTLALQDDAKPPSILVNAGTPSPCVSTG